MPMNIVNVYNIRTKCMKLFEKALCCSFVMQTIAPIRATQDAIREILNG